MRFTRGAVAAVLVAGLGGLTALAQPPGGGRGFGFGGGGRPSWSTPRPSRRS